MLAHLMYKTSSDMKFRLQLFHDLPRMMKRNYITLRLSTEELVFLVS